MNPINDYIQSLLYEAEKAIVTLQSYEGTEESIDLMKKVQEAIKNDDIETLNKIIEENGNKNN